MLQTLDLGISIRCSYQNDAAVVVLDLTLFVWCWMGHFSSTEVFKMELDAHSDDCGDSICVSTMV